MDIVAYTADCKQVTVVHYLDTWTVIVAVEVILVKTQHNVNNEETFVIRS